MRSMQCNLCRAGWAGCSLALSRGAGLAGLALWAGLAGSPGRLGCAGLAGLALWGWAGLAVSPGGLAWLWLGYPGWGGVPWLGFPGWVTLAGLRWCQCKLDGSSAGFPGWPASIWGCCLPGWGAEATWPVRPPPVVPPLFGERMNVYCLASTRCC